jgi:hypothetical protein
MGQYRVKGGDDGRVGKITGTVSHIGHSEKKKWAQRDTAPKNKNERKAPIPIP